MDASTEVKKLHRWARAEALVTTHACVISGVCWHVAEVLEFITQSEAACINKTKRLNWLAKLPWKPRGFDPKRPQYFCEFGVTCAEGACRPKTLAFLFFYFLISFFTKIYFRSRNL